jgi:hypothetical protein
MGIDHWCSAEAFSELAMKTEHKLNLYLFLTIDSHLVNNCFAVSATCTGLLEFSPFCSFKLFKESGL